MEPLTVSEAVELARQQSPVEMARRLEPMTDAAVLEVLGQLDATTAELILERLGGVRRQRLMDSAPPALAERWRWNMTYPKQSVGRLMDPPRAMFPPDQTVRQTIEQLRELVRKAFITYAYVVDGDQKLLGVVVMRELLFADPDAPLSSIMLASPFALRAEMPLMDAMKAVLHRHFPVYPVCDDAGRLVGLMRGGTMFDAQAIELTAQAGAMVGVEKEERLFTPWPTSLRFRHPWLQLNLVTCFVAAGVVGFFEGTIERIVVLAVFLPVLAGQSGNTGCQALAMTLRAMTLGDLRAGRGKMLVIKEAWLGLLNGLLVGFTAGLGMMVYAMMQGRSDGMALGGIVMAAMACSCIISGISGALVPMGLQRLGCDPATASSIFLTTSTDVASMGIFLGLATMLL